LFSNEVGYRKPGRQLLDAALAAVQVPAREACFVGDRIDRDIFAGRRAGLGLCVLREAPSGPGRSIEGVEPDYTVKDLAELLVLPGIGSGLPRGSASSRPSQLPGNVTTSATT
jgi:FMN phosphatase YigB (HAD superfamily)